MFKDDKLHETRYCENCLELQQKLQAKEQECERIYKQVEILNEKLLRKRAVVKFADCSHYSYGENTIEPTCTKNFCYDVKSCDHKNMVKLKQALDEIEKYQQRNCEVCVFANTQKCNINCQVFVILDIINKAKDSKQ